MSHVVILKTRSQGSRNVTDFRQLKSDRNERNQRGDPQARRASRAGRAAFEAHPSSLLLPSPPPTTFRFFPASIGSHHPRDGPPAYDLRVVLRRLLRQRRLTPPRRTRRGSSAHPLPPPPSLHARPTRRLTFSSYASCDLRSRSSRVSSLVGRNPARLHRWTQRRRQVAPIGSMWRR